MTYRSTQIARNDGIFKTVDLNHFKLQNTYVQNTKDILWSTSLFKCA